MPTLASLHATRGGATTFAINGVWDVDLLDVVAEQQAVIEGETINVNVSGPIAVTGTFWQATQPVSLSGTVPISAAALPLPSGASTEATLAALNAKVTAVNTGAVVVTSAPTTAVTGPLTDTQLRATPVPISGTVTANAGTNLNTSALALEAGNLASIKAKTDNIPPLGQALAAASVPVILPSATITTLTPPAAITGFATSAKQDTGNTSVASIDTKTPALGQALAAASTPVVLTAAQITTLTPPAAIAGFALESTQLLQATAANQTTGNTSLGTIETNTDPLVASGGGGYVRQDSTATIAKETGGNLATIATNSALSATAAKQDLAQVSLTTIAALSKAEDSVSADLDTGIPALAVRTDTPTLPPTSLNGDYQFLITDNLGRLWTNTDALAEINKRSNDLAFASARLFADQLRMQNMMSGAFVPIPEVF